MLVAPGNMYPLLGTHKYLRTVTETGTTKKNAMVLLFKDVHDTKPHIFYEFHQKLRCFKKMNTSTKIWLMYVINTDSCTCIHTQM